MKRYYILLIIFAIFFYSCFKADYRGQYPTDSVPPKEIKSPEVKNVPGGAIISYVIPDDPDLLYVKASYTLDDGTVVEQKASAYASSLKIEGIGKSREVDVSVVAGDRSQNESSPVVVKTHPLDAPIYSILGSVKAYDDFGGIRLTWANPDEAEVVLAVITTDSLGEFVVTQNFYTKSKDGFGSVRGFPSEDRVFGWYLRDRWGNLTDTIKGNFHPLFEEEAKGKFARWNPPGISYNQYGSYAIEKMWDDITTDFYIQAGITYPWSFTFDIGQTVKLSRIKIWQRQGATLVYAVQSVKDFQVWGSATPNVTADFSGWTHIGDFTSYKPSGSPLGVNTADDIAYAAAGQDYNIDPSAPPIRYVRFVVQSTWANDNIIAFGEMKFFGAIQ